MYEEKISQFPLFADLPGSACRALKKSTQECHFLSGQVLFTEGSSSDQVYFLVNGEVEIIKSLDTADERCVAISKKGAVLGEMSMFSQEGTHTASARARTAVKLLMIPTTQFDEVLQRHPEITYKLLRLFTNRLENSENLTIQDLREKNRQLLQAYEDLQAAQAAMIENEKLEHELKIAGEMQRNILPEGLPKYKGWDFGALMIPARQVGGDFYDFIPLDEHQIAIVIGDVCDKGMPAALFMALTYSLIRAEAHRHETPSTILQAVNNHLLQINRSGMFVTLLFGILNTQSREFVYARAGHTTPLVLNNHVQMIDLPFSLGQPLGIFDEFAIDTGGFILPSKGSLIIYSDGLSETIDDHLELPRLPQLCAKLIREDQLSAQSLCDQLWRTVGGSVYHSQIKDDFTVVVIRSI
ncbi:MAG: SpoIIE family protein phosphatase [Brevefilum sp.]|nr:SpoIIE family protein phosphatase [Brevefilum sp.]